MILFSMAYAAAKLLQGDQHPIEDKKLDEEYDAVLGLDASGANAPNRASRTA